MPLGFSLSLYRSIGGEIEDVAHSYMECIDWNGNHNSIWIQSRNSFVEPNQLTGLIGWFFCDSRDTNYQQKENRQGVMLHNDLCSLS